MDPSGVYTTSPDSFTVTHQLAIDADINKEYDCSDHFFIITNSDYFGSFGWSSQADRITIVWNCDELYVYHPTSSVSQPSSSTGIHHMHIMYTQTSIRVVTDVDGVELYAEGTFWENVWLWIGADDDNLSGSEFYNVKTNTCHDSNKFSLVITKCMYFVVKLKSMETVFRMQTFCVILCLIVS